MWKSPQFQFRTFSRKEATEPFNHKLRHGFEIEIKLLGMMFGTLNQKNPQNLILKILSYASKID